MENVLILCANLKRRKDRRFVIENTIPHINGSKVNFIDAIDGSAIPQWKMSRYPKGTKTSGYAVRLTKRLALRRFLQSSAEYLLYLEDDVVISDKFEKKLLKALTKKYDVLFLGGGHHSAPIGKGKWKKCTKTYNNHALLFSREGAEKALKIFGKWTEAWSDRELQAAMSNGLIDAWCVKNWVAFQRDTVSDNWGNQNCVRLAKLAKPLMLPDDLAALDAALYQSKKVIEFGSGGSTLHIGFRLKDRGHLVSIEHDIEWHKRVKKQVKKRELPVTCVFSPPIPLRNDDGPWRFLPNQMKNYIDSFSSHVSSESIDLVFVDGRERIKCALAVWKSLKKDGLLMIHDFWGRERYRSELPLLLERYDYLFETPQRKTSDPQGMAIFRKKSLS